MSRRIFACAVATACAGAWLMLGPPRTLSAQGTGSNSPDVVGAVSPLIPMQSTEAVHMGLVWKKGSNKPKILYHARFPEYRGIDMADPALTDLAIARGALTNSDSTTSRNNFNTTLRDVINGFDPPAAPFLRLRPTDCTADDPRPSCKPDDSFQRLTYGAYLMRQGLSQSVPTRIVANREMERQLLFDISHPDAFKTTGKFHTALLDENDFALNRAAFQENGYSKGMFYNTYCNARVTLADGKVYVFGGHDMQSNNGLYKVNIFDPETEEWVRRTESCTRAGWERDRFGRDLFSRNPDAQFFENCDPREQQNTQPSDPSDQKYARWYPSAAPLPNGWILVIGGFDQDGTIAPDPARAAKGRQNTSQTDTDFTATRVNIVVPEVYDPKTDRNIALENARMAFPLYPQMEVVQTGPGKEDWKVCTFNGRQDYGDIADELPAAGAAYRNANGERTLGAARFLNFRTVAGQENGTTWCLDVVGAMKDPNRNIPAKNHWTLLDATTETRPYCCPTASLVEIDKNGKTISHRWFMISGQNAAGSPTDTIEVIDFAEQSPQWRPAGNLAYALTTRKAVVLPDGKVLLGHGTNRGLATTGNPLLDFERREGLRFHMYDPDTFAVTPLTTTTVSRTLHGTATLLPDATVFFAGENREALIRNNDPSFPMMSSYAGLLPAGDPDQGVPVGQVFYPPYLFKSGGQRAAQPVITNSPDRIAYRGHFDVTVAGDARQIGSVALLRSDHNTHSFTGGDRYVKLAFEPKDSGGKQGSADKRKLRVTAPQLPAQAVPGVYMLFVVDKNGVPSVGKQVRILPESRGETTPFR
jgi:hypothetical protein